MMYVVGSGPAGVSCAAALLDRGHDVTLLDVGLELEPERQALRARLRATERARWTADTVGFLKENMTATGAGIPRKHTYGSDFPYRDADGEGVLDAPGVGAVPSMARGGLSNVWGAAVLPYRADDIPDWPLSADDLAPHYRAVLGFMSLAGQPDELQELFPLHTEHPQPLAPSRQAATLLDDLRTHRDALHAARLHFGAARLAVNAAQCVYCTHCMYGCPWELIYNSAHTLRTLREHKRFTYTGGVVVDRVSEGDGQVTLHAHRPRSGERRTFTAARAFLACGTVNTTRILLESLQAWDHPLTMLDSQYFLFPLLRYRSVRDVRGEPLHALAQVFLEIVDPDVSDRTVHLQIYTYNDLYESALRGVFRGLHRALDRPLEALRGRLLLVQGYLDSSRSPSISVSLHPDAGTRRLEMRPVANARTAPAVAAVLRTLRAHRHLLRALPAAALLRRGAPGQGFHSGGTIPMRRTPTDWEADVLGRPYGFERLHLVDSTTFPSIPATTITFTVMANAHRIGSAAADA